MTKLKPCPFCGRSDYLKISGDDDVEWYEVVCQWCGGQGNRTTSSSEAVKSWNMRSPQASMSATITRMENGHSLWECGNCEEKFTLFEGWKIGPPRFCFTCGARARETIPGKDTPTTRTEHISDVNEMIPEPEV